MKKYSLCLSVIILLLASVQLQSCKKDKSADPEIQTVSVTALSPTNVLFKGNIVSKGSFNILDYGFVYSTTTSAISETVGTKVSLGSAPSIGQYSKEVDGITVTSSYSPVLYVRAYITNTKGTAFGTLSSVTLPSPTASSISPQTGKSGDQVSINGQFYTAGVSDVKVSFNGTQANIVSVSSTQIVATVPSGILAAHDSQIPIQVSVGGLSTTLSYYFTIQANFKDYSPKSGPIGTLITFTGDNLPTYYYSYSDLNVFLGSVSQGLSYSSPTQVTVPSNITTNNFQISVVESGKTYTLPGTFNITAPTISSLSPGSGLAGSSVTVTGANFPTSYGITATLGNESVSTSPYSSNQFSFTVPTDLSPGSYTFTLTAGPNSVSASQKFTVTAPTISSFTPSSGAVGGQVTINGSFVAGQYYTVYFGSSSTSVYASSSNSLIVNVPYGTSAGAVKISAVIGGQTVTAPGTFTVTTPTITSFSPTSGVAGSIVTITGTGFNSPYGASVSFGSVNANVLSVTSTTITVAVPSNTGNGAMKITVNTSGQSVVSTDNFTVTN